MRVTADTNILLRLAVVDDIAQQKAARAAVEEADLVVVPTHSLCEFVWVMERSYRRQPVEIATSIRQLVGVANVEFDRPSVSAGLATLDAGGDFADGVIAFDGALQGGETFLTFDKKAASLLRKQGNSVRLLK